MTNEQPESDRPHAIAAEETGFWGRQGAGCLVLSRATGRLLVALRSEEVMEPGTWGTWGGAVDEGLTPEQCVALELQQETGYTAPVDLHLVSTYSAPGDVFRYHNFLAVIDDEFEPLLNWENDAFCWVKPSEMPSPLHFGLESLCEGTALWEAIEACLGRPGHDP